MDSRLSRRSPHPAAAVPALLAAAVACTAGSALAQAPAWPSKPVRIVVGFVPGGATDTIGRTVAQQLGERFGRTVVVENRAGASGTIAAEFVARAPADGYTMIMATQTTHAVVPYMMPKLPYDPIRDFTPVVIAAQNTLLVVVTPSMPVKSIKDLVALARTRPGELSFATGGVGSSPHMAGELFARMAKVQMTPVFYKGDAAAVVDVIGGRVPIMFLNITNMIQHIRAGKLRGLAVTAGKRSAILPEFPTVAEGGLPGFEVVTWFGLLAPAGTPADVVSRINRDTNQALAVPAVREQMATLGIEPVGGTPEQFAALLKEENARWSRMVGDLRLRTD
ncbi:MAG: tripartite tricarboxylate transporter substrate binding protein [Rhodocyclaceae bacterium]|nr:tripartite tricarboxylate transporter substrate binding protein [Rhodocyclaceae bacterium]MCE2980993.1 tripartite tricarboxylate transporter substrate binding protein [Betaproteobacteria bacterium]MCA3076388.1 tripartite tricarboxylate transporter substrate binding protein [Rhodocyclaceae bacterium]MCA3088425.1 tripartite tricarboxylate transporter substrate binding protein [Rhodocyclaceae bacterium]MCA3094325.1 tripartite tricarboxylate transporter substrate binding protein [Rhodocyclaceae 